MPPGSKKRWSDLSTRQQQALVCAGVVQMGVQIAALTDLRRRPASRLNGAKPVWVGLSFVSFLGPLAYFVFGRRDG
jgi:hypothetical protein